jgi:hypothetical protein
MSGSRFSDQTIRIFKALKKTNPRAAYAYLDGAYKREEIDRHARVVLGGTYNPRSTTIGELISASKDDQPKAESSMSDTS